jgi:FtsH-binding integral membrane protein
MSEEEVDPAELQRELETIKDAMGLQERSESATSVWLLFGLLVPIAALASQYVHLERLPQFFHTPIWLGVIGVGVFAYFGFSGRREFDIAPGKPNVAVQFVVVYLASIPLQTIASAYAPDLGYEAESALALSIIVVLVGIGYAILGTSLRAYRIRRRDRAVFFAGTAWMVALGVAIPQVAVLQTWGYAAFGGVYFIYAMAAYLLLSRT